MWDIVRNLGLTVALSELFGRVKLVPRACEQKWHTKSSNLCAKF